LVDDKKELPELPFPNTSKPAQARDNRFRGMKKNARALYDDLLKKYGYRVSISVGGNEPLRKMAFDCRVDNVPATVKGFAAKGLATYDTDGKPVKPKMISFMLLPNT